jgi:hypothetical protein
MHKVAVNLQDDEEEEVLKDQPLKGVLSFFLYSTHSLEEAS